MNVKERVKVHVQQLVPMIVLEAAKGHVRAAVRVVLGVLGVLILVQVRVRVVLGVLAVLAHAKTLALIAQALAKVLVQAVLAVLPVRILVPASAIMLVQQLPKLPLLLIWVRILFEGISSKPQIFLK